MRLFARLDPETISALGDLVVPMELERGEVLFREGAEGGSLYVIDSGEVRVLARSGSQEVTRIGAGGHLGEMALIDDAPPRAGTLSRPTE